MVCTTPAYLETHPLPHNPADLATHNCLTHRLDQAETTWRFRPKAGGDDLEVRVSGSLQTDFGMATIALLYSGVGIGLLPDWLAARDVARGGLVQLFPEYHVSHIDFENDIYAVYQRGRNMSPKIHAFVNFFAESLKTDVGRLSAESMFSAKKLFAPE
jgi:DNA-binding transcriptional LysR family regulator